MPLEAQEKLSRLTQAARTALMLAQRSALFAVFWWFLTEGQQDSWFIGISAVLLATAASYAIARPSPRSLFGLLRFFPFFVIHSLRGAIDVSWRALHPALPIAPVLVDYRLRLDVEEARVFMANTVSLVPGTLTARLVGECLQVHVLDGRGSYLAELEELERHVAAMFRIPLAKLGDGDV